MHAKIPAYLMSIGLALKRATRGAVILLLLLALVVLYIPGLESAHADVSTPARLAHWIHEHDLPLTDAQFLAVEDSGDSSDPDWLHCCADLPAFVHPPVLLRQGQTLTFSLQNDGHPGGSRSLPRSDPL